MKKKSNKKVVIDFNLLDDTFPLTSLGLCTCGEEIDLHQNVVKSPFDGDFDCKPSLSMNPDLPEFPVYKLAEVTQVGRVYLYVSNDLVELIKKYDLFDHFAGLYVKRSPNSNYKLLKNFVKNEKLPF